MDTLTATQAETVAERLANLLAYVNAGELVDKLFAMLAEEQAGTLVDNFVDVEAKALHHKLAYTLEVVEADFIGYTLVCV